MTPGAGRLPVAVVVGVLATLVTFAPDAAAAAVIGVTPGAVDAIINGNCSIREAIVAANTDSGVDACTAGSGADTVNASGMFVLTTADNGGNGLPVITSTITMNGAQINRPSGAPAFRIFAVASTGNLTLNGATVNGGLARDCPNQPGDVCGGGIASQGTLSVNGSGIVNNAATNTAPAFSQAVGGGIVSTGNLTVRDSRFNGNTTSCSGSGSPVGCFSLGGAIYNSVGTLDMRSSEVVSNGASCSGANCVAVGGGITNDDTSTVTGSRVNGNAASCSGSGCTAIGGGIGMFGTVNVMDSQVSGNIASCSTSGCLARGGGLDNNFDGTLNVNGSQVVRNTVSAPVGTARGGGLYNGSGVTILNSSAVIGNTAGGATAEGGGIYKESGSVILNNDQVSGNTPNNCTPSIGSCT
jgi:hypothetical protein